MDDKGHQLELQQVRLRPFFLARYELTKAQWVRLTYGRDIDYGDPGYNRLDSRTPDGKSIAAINPVEWVSFEMAMPLLARDGLTLPDERQWEFACGASCLRDAVVQRQCARDHGALRQFRRPHVR